MFFRNIKLGPLETNCYLLGCKETNKALVIDPATEGDFILKILKKEGFVLEKIINTHGHWDHTGANAYLKAATGAKIYIHEDDEAFLNDEILSGKSLLGGVGESVDADRLLRHGDQIVVGTLKFDVIHTPGHTPGCICLRIKNKLFTGDTLFASSIGRTDLAGGSYAKIIESIRTKLLPLEDELEIYPGHGPDSTMKYEKKHNPFLK